MSNITGRAAIAYAEANNLLNKYTDPTEEARDDLTIEEAREVAGEDPSLIWIDVEITTSDIAQLETEAGEHGDMEQVELCRAALNGDAAARAKCERAILSARANV